MIKQKIVFLINSLDGGGAERVVANLLNYLVNRYDCYLIMMENSIRYDLDKRVHIIHLNEKISSNGLYKLIRLPIIAYKLATIIKKYQFQRVVSFIHRANYVNAIASYFTKFDTIISERVATSSFYSSASLTDKINRFLVSKLYNRANLIISVSKAIEKDLVKNYNIKTKMITIYNPYDIEKIHKLSLEDISFDMDKEYSIISVGSLIKRKNHQLIIKALSKLDQKYQLYILGKGEEEKNLRSLAIDLGVEDRVHLLGFDNNPYKYLQRASIFVLPSLGEGFPNVLAEALSCKLCVIASDCLSGPREILAPKSDVEKVLKEDIELAEYGILTPVNDENALVEALKLIDSDRELKNRYIQKSKKRIYDFTIDKIAQKYVEAVV